MGVCVSAQKALTHRGNGMLCVFDAPYSTALLLHSKCLLVFHPSNANTSTQHTHTHTGMNLKLGLKCPNVSFSAQTEKLCFKYINASFYTMYMLVPRAPSPSPGGAGPVRSVTRVPAGQMEATTFDIFRNLKRCQCDWLRCVYKRAKGTRYYYFIMARTSSLLPFIV